MCQKWCGKRLKTVHKYTVIVLSKQQIYEQEKKELSLFSYKIVRSTHKKKSLLEIAKMNTFDNCFVDI